MEKARIEAKVSGLVQGVGYRFFVQREAYSLNLSGYAKNLWDGKVEVIVEGDKDKLLKFLEALKKGPWLSQVKDIKAVWREYKGEFKGFGVL
ncbi:MAG: acylphosphatase [Armatimonadetes bacterium CG07_land_8_20_14_0_80_40_9]|nr:MAG: acylphosphatase [Armatimonadetes bacterium CG07_land_8_20_14_0_80_40_9]